MKRNRSLAGWAMPSSMLGETSAPSFSAGTIGHVYLWLPCYSACRATNRDLAVAAIKGNSSAIGSNHALADNQGMHRTEVPGRVKYMRALNSPRMSRLGCWTTQPPAKVWRQLRPSQGERPSNRKVCIHPAVGKRC